MTYKEAYEFGKSFLAGYEESDALLLLEYASGLDRNVLYVHPETIIDDEAKDKYTSFLQRRKNNEPVQYITGRTYFYGMEILTEKEVLIPRFDTETLVEEALKVIKPGDRVLDVCTGSGCIILAIAANSKEIKAEASDISQKAIDLAEKNSDKLGFDIKFLLGDMFEKASGKYDVIVSNPPYIERKVIESLDETVKDYEPKLALDGGEDGLDYYKVIAAEAKKFLVQDGFLLCEIGYDQGKTVKNIFEENGFLFVRVIKDLCGNDRVVSAVYGG